MYCFSALNLPALSSINILETEVTFCFSAVLLINADDQTIVDILQKTNDHGFDQEFVYVIIDLDNNLGPTPWQPTEYGVKIEKVMQ